MPNISLPTGKVIYISVYEYYFQLEDKNIDEFYQSCIADDLGIYVEDPFSQRIAYGKIDVEEIPDELIDEDLL